MAAGSSSLQLCRSVGRDPLQLQLRCTSDGVRAIIRGDLSPSAQLPSSQSAVPPSAPSGSSSDTSGDEGAEVSRICCSRARSSSSAANRSWLDVTPASRAADDGSTAIAEPGDEVASVAADMARDEDELGSSGATEVGGGDLVTRRAGRPNRTSIEPVDDALESDPADDVRARETAVETWTFGGDGAQRGVDAG